LNLPPYPTNTVKMKTMTTFPIMLKELGKHDS
jgi:hypothetical protein